MSLTTVSSIQSHCPDLTFYLQRVNEHCFEHCIPKPGSTMSSSEESCLSHCMEKYISMWNVVNRTYVGRMSSESKRMGQDAVALSQLSTPSDK